VGKQAIEAGDLATVCAVINAQPFFSGIVEGDREVRRALAAEKFAPVVWAQMRAGMAVKAKLAVTRVSFEREYLECPPCAAPSRKPPTRRWRSCGPARRELQSLGPDSPPRSERARGGRPWRWSSRTYRAGATWGAGHGAAAGPRSFCFPGPALLFYEALVKLANGAAELCRVSKGCGHWRAITAHRVGRS
jgi:hypothetical protein